MACLVLTRFDQPLARLARARQKNTNNTNYHRSRFIFGHFNDPWSLRAGQCFLSDSFSLGNFDLALTRCLYCCFKLPPTSWFLCPAPQARLTRDLRPRGVKEQRGNSPFELLLSYPITLLPSGSSWGISSSDFQRSPRQERAREEARETRDTEKSSEGNPLGCFGIPWSSWPSFLLFLGLPKAFAN